MHCEFSFSKHWYFGAEMKWLPRRFNIQKFGSDDFIHDISRIAVQKIFNTFKV